MMLLRGGVASSCAAIVARGFSTTTRYVLNEVLLSYGTAESVMVYH